MNYIHGDSHQATRDIANRVQQEITSGKKVLLLVSGGSNILAATQITSSLSSEQSRHVTIGLIDERYGSVGHQNSNWQALLSAGFNGQQATLMPILIEGLDRESTAKHYESALRQALDQTDVRIGLLGMGDDGHTAGILPGSPACDSTTQKLVVDYTSDPYQRITLSFAGIQQLDCIYLLAFGEHKVSQLKSLLHVDVPLNEQPVQIIKRIREAYVYNDVYTEGL